VKDFVASEETRKRICDPAARAEQVVTREVHVSRDERSTLNLQAACISCAHARLWLDRCTGGNDLRRLN
jgi:hypothetical protein